MGNAAQFGNKLDAAPDDIDNLDNATAMSLFKGMVMRLDDIREAIEEIVDDAEDKPLWQYAAATGGITGTADTTIAPAPETDGHRNYVTGLQILNTDATVPSEIVIKDNTTVIWRGFAQHTVAAVSQPGMVGIVFPGRGLQQPSVNSPLKVAMITDSTQTYVNAQGYTGP